MQVHLNFNLNFNSKLIIKTELSVKVEVKAETKMKPLGKGRRRDTPYRREGKGSCPPPN